MSHLYKRTLFGSSLTCTASSTIPSLSCRKVGHGTGFQSWNRSLAELVTVTYRKTFPSVFLQPLAGATEPSDHILKKEVLLTTWNRWTNGTGSPTPLRPAPHCERSKGLLSVCLSVFLLSHSVFIYGAGLSLTNTASFEAVFQLDTYWLMYTFSSSVRHSPTLNTYFGMNSIKYY